MKKIQLIFMPFFILSACNPFGKEVSLPVEQDSAATIFSMPAIPNGLKNVSDQEAYLATHYWDNFDFGLRIDSSNKEEIDQRFADYLQLLTVIPEEQVKAAITGFMDRVVKSPTSFRHFINLSRHYLNQPQSPYKNEEWYIMLLEYMVRSTHVDGVNKIKAQYQLKMLYKNRLGNVATDFTFSNAASRRSNLYSLSSPYTLVLFYDPDCEFCQATIAELKQYTLLNNLQQQKVVKVLAVYTEANSKLWLDYQSHIPSKWLNVTDHQEIMHEEKYDLRALPSLYLLDQDKKILLKDASMGALKDYLEKKGLVLGSNL